jgi:hypothetical protein
MSKFNYTLPSGAGFVVNGPSGATQADADRIFYEQVAAGSLVGYQPGQTLTGAETQITKFELSRLDRGTAGVDTPTVLAIVQGLPVLARIPNLSNVPLSSPINEGDIVAIKGNDLDPLSVGPLSSYQIQKLLAQIANLVGQESDKISQDKGIGRYGFTAYALEQAGYVKSGTSLKFFSIDGSDFVAVMSSPSVWTGKDGIYSLADLLNDAELQNRIQVQLMQQGYNDLLAAGVIAQQRSSSINIETGQIYTTGGLQSVQALVAASLLGTNLGSLDSVAKNALSQSASLNRLISYTDVNLDTIGSGAVNGLPAGPGNLANLNAAALGAGITNQVAGSVGALIANASKFTSQYTALWAKSGGINGVANLAQTNLSNIGTTVSKLVNGQLTNITGNLNNINTTLTNLVPGNLGTLTSGLDVFGKASSFATNFANPLGNLNNLGAVLTPGGIGGALTAQLGSLQGQLGGLRTSLTGLGNFANLGAASSLFGGGGDLVSGTRVAAGFNNTVNRATVDAAFARIVGSAKVPLPTFQYPSLAALGPRLDVQQALGFLGTQSRSAGATFGQTVTI